MNRRIYKNLQLAGALAIFLGTIAIRLEADMLAATGWLTGLLLLFCGVVGAWFNDV